MALCSSRAATLESTPPESPSTTRPSPTWARMALIFSSMNWPAFQSSFMAHTCRKLRSTLAPWVVWVTSGWNWMANWRRARFSMAATGTPGVRAVTVKPAGACSTWSPWLIHTCCSGSRPWNRTLSGSCTWMAALPYSRRAERWMTPPGVAGQSCWP